MTAARDMDVVRRAVTQGVVAYLVKPFRFATFRARLDQYAAYRQAVLDGAGRVAQSEVDDVYAVLRPTPASLPKGLSGATLREVLSGVRSAAGPLSAGQVAEATGVSRVTARRYLEFLAESGDLERGIRHGGRGRPEIDYRPA